MKIIFLDVDGVLNNSRSKENFENMAGCETAKIKLLRKIVKATDAILVLSSDWRISESHFKYLNARLNKHGLRISSQTPVLKRSHRGFEINSWLRKNDDLNIESWIIIDDEIFTDFYSFDDEHGRPYIDHLVLTNDFYTPNGGLSQEDVDEAIELLNNV